MFKKIKVLLFICVILLTLSLTHEEQSYLGINKIVLDNGFTIYLNEDHSSSKIYGAVVVKAGGKDVPDDATGIAHYLEHLMFMGTDQMGTVDYNKEKPYLDEINKLFDKLNAIRDKTDNENVNEKEAINKKINELSIEAAKYVIPKEFAKVMQSIGGKDVNGYTNRDSTVYVNIFPSNQIEKWLEVYSNRFINPVFRHFQAELEVIREEKNRALNNSDSVLNEELFKNFYKDNPYGTKTTLGSIDDLMYPSVSKMTEFYNKYYVANNMALVLVGDFDTDKILPVIKGKFSKLKKGEVPVEKIKELKPFKGREYVYRSIPVENMGVLGFRTVPLNHPDYINLLALKYLLYNKKKTGLLNDYIENNKLDSIEVFVNCVKETGGFFIYFLPKQNGLTVNAGEKEIMINIAKIRKGEISDDLVKSIKNLLIFNLMADNEYINDRADMLIDSFAYNIDIKSFNDFISQAEKITKEDIVKTANKYLTDNYMSFFVNPFYSDSNKEYFPKSNLQAINFNQTALSNYAKKIIDSPTLDKKPVLFDYNKDVSVIEIKKNCKLYYSKNNYNNKFELKMNFGLGSYESQYLPYAVKFFSSIGAKTFNRKDYQMQFEAISCDFDLSYNDSYFIVRLSGIEENLDKSLKLINDLLYEPNLDEKEFKKFVKDEVKYREEEEKWYTNNPLKDYLLYQNESKYIKRPIIADIKKLKKEDINNTIKEAMKYKMSITYTGKNEPVKVKEIINNNLKLSDDYKDSKSPIIKKKYEYKKDTIFVYNNFNKSSCRIYFYIPDNNISFDKFYRIKTFNQYFGDGLNSIYYKIIRESSSLAYALDATYYYNIVDNKTINGYFYSFMQCKTEKIGQAIDKTYNLIKNMPEENDTFDQIKNGLINSIYLDKIHFRDIPEDIFDNESLGLDPKTDYDYMLHEQYKKMSMNDLMEFYNNSLKNKTIIMLIATSRDYVDFQKLSEYGEVIELSKEKIFKDY